MRKKRLFVWALTLVCTLLSFSCKDDKESGGNVIADNYFTIRDASFTDEYLPTGITDLLGNFNVTSLASKGGISTLSFTSAQKLDYVYVGVKGRTGYYEQNVQNRAEYVQVSIGVYYYYYEIALNIREDIDVPSFILAVSAVDGNGQISKEYTGTITIGSSALNNLSPYFTIGSSTFVNNIQPVGVYDLINNFSVGKSAVQGGSVLISFTSLEKMSKVLIGVSGETGYYQVDITTEPPLQQLGVNHYEYYYEISLLVNQQITVTSFEVVVTAETENAYITHEYKSGVSVTNPVLGNPIEDYFTLQGGAFVADDLPTGTEKMINNLSVNEYAINGGSSIVSFTSKEMFNEINVGVVGERGYYKQIVGNYPLADNGEYSYQALLNINEDISKDIFKVKITGKTKDGRISSEASSDNISVIEVGTGDLQISLSWNQEDDLDLHVIDPYGNHISYYDPYSFGDAEYETEVKFYFYCYLVNSVLGYNTSSLNHLNDADRDKLSSYVRYLSDLSTQELRVYWDNFLNRNPYSFHGFLDLDSNAGCYIDGYKNENIYFEAPVNGTYKIYVDLWSKCSDNAPGANYSVTVRYRGEVVEVKTGAFDRYNMGNYDDESGYVEIGSYTVTGSRASTYVRQQNENSFLKIIQEKFRVK